MLRKIMIIEDEPDIMDIICLVLECDDYMLIPCTSIRVFRQELEQHVPDLIILDVKLPDGNGIEVCNEIKSEPPLKHVPVMLMSAHIGSQKLAESCADIYMEKPFDINDLKEKVELLLNR